MPPLIIEDSHDKTPCTLSELKKISGFVKIFEEVTSDLHPDDLEIRFSVLEYSDELSGCVVIEIIDNFSECEAIGNINFKKISYVDAWFENGIHITSTYINAEYRGLGIAIKAYEILTHYYPVLSDRTQTHDGAAFWKFKMGSNANLKIFLALWNGTKRPEIILGNDDIPLIYNTTKIELESFIWGLESPNSKMSSAIKAHSSLKRDDIVLVAVNIIDTYKVLSNTPFSIS